MRMSVENLDLIRAWALRNQDAMPELTLRLVFATDLAKSVIEQESAPDPQRVIEVGYDIGSLMWRIRAVCRYESDGIFRQPAGDYAAATRVFLDAFRRGMVDTAAIVEYIDNRVGRSLEIGEMTGHDPVLDMPEFGFRMIRIERDGDAYIFEDLSDPPCRSSRIRNLRSSIGKARRM
jgi:hypothetical protein